MQTEKRWMGKAPLGGGIYVMLKNGRCIYIGQSSNFIRRIRVHTRIFDDVRFIPIARRACRLSLEAALIAALKPRDNIQRPRARAWSPDGLDIWGMFSRWRT